MSPNTKDIYVKLQRLLGWEKIVYIYWKVEWQSKEWERIMGRLWTSKGIDHMKVFIWKALWGVLPIGEKVVVRGIGSVV